MPNRNVRYGKFKRWKTDSESLDQVLETASMNGQRHHSRHGSSLMNSGSGSAGSIQQNLQIQRLQREVETLGSERDALKIRMWELEKRPYTQQQHQQSIRTVHFIDLRMGSRVWVELLRL